MIQVLVYKQSEYPIDEQKLKDRIIKTLEKQNFNSDIAVSVALVEEDKMDELVKKFYHREGPDFGNRPHPILTFPTREMTQDFVFSPDEINDLGEMVISYPQAQQKAKEEGKETQEIINDLAEHGALHLAGVHH